MEYVKYLYKSYIFLLAVRRIAKNDVNKKSLVAQGSLPVLVSLTESKYEDEQIGKGEKDLNSKLRSMNLFYVMNFLRSCIS